MKNPFTGQHTMQTFKVLKLAAFVLGLPHCGKSFMLFAQEGQGTASGIVTDMLNPTTLLLLPREGRTSRLCSNPP